MEVVGQAAWALAGALFALVVLHSAVSHTSATLIFRDDFKTINASCGDCTSG
jgi:hypothetical protein